MCDYGLFTHVTFITVILLMFSHKIISTLCVKNCMRNKLLSCVLKRHVDFLQHNKIRIRSFSTQKEEDTLKKIRIKTSRFRWEEYHDGLDYNVSYVDTGSNNKDSPVVLCIHGSPGSHVDFSALQRHLAAAEDCRFIVPNLPGYGLTKVCHKHEKLVFMQTNCERAEFIADFLEHLGVHRVDVIVTHSYGVFPVLKILARTTDFVKSAMFICPTPHEPHRAIRPYNAMKIINELWEDRLFRPLVKLLLFMTKRFIGFPSFSTSQMVESVRTVAAVDYRDINSYCLEVVIKNVPLVFMYSLNDKLIESDLSREFVRLLGVKDSHCVTYDKDTSESGITKIFKGYPRCLVFEKGSHSPQVKSGLSNIIAHEVMQLIKSTRDPQGK